ncbi:MAG TPA: hypothetical protein VNZ02_08045 [Steroidobacteraceae bacterium]|jgi:hypothetical protein|nr:hypothetical protein [Steroidobacteraceae bacterium]
MNVTDRDANTREEIHRKLAQSREEVSRLLDPPRGNSATNGQAGAPGHSDFPRSRTMKILLSGRGLGAIGALAAGLLIARPALALRLLKVLPVSALAKTLIARVMTTLKAGPEDPQP